jgi:hypothetical protein
VKKEATREFSPDVFEVEYLRAVDGRPIARYNPDKTISVSIVFEVPRFSDVGNRGQFVVKVKAPRGTWERWTSAWEEKRLVSFQSVRRYLSRPRKTDVKELSDFAKADPEGFASQLQSGVQEALFAIRDKPRGGNPYGLDPQTTERIRRESKHIYAWMKLWISDPPEMPRPPEIQRVVDKSWRVDKDNRRRVSAKVATLLIMGKRGIVSADPESFYKHFTVAGGGLTAVCAYRDNIVRRALAFLGKNPEKTVNWLIVPIPIREGSRLIDFLS